MSPVLQLDQAGLGIFSASGLITILGSWLLLATLHPLGLAASRMSDALSACFSYRSPTSLRGLDSSAANALSCASLLRGEALLPGIALFLIGVLSSFSTDLVHRYDLFAMSPSPVELIAVFGIGLFVLFGCVDNLDISWRNQVVSRSSGIGNIASYAIVLAVFLLSGYSPIAALAYLAAGTAARTIAVLSVRGLRLFGVGSLIWVPAMLIAWLVVTMVAAVLGPLIFLVSRLTEKASFASLPLGNARERQISQAELALPRSYALDCLPGMSIPR